MDYFGDMPKRRAVGGRGTDQYNMAQRDPMVHEIKGQMGAERAMEGRGTSAQEYRKLQNASHAHMRGGAMAGGAPSMAGGRPQLAGGAMAGGRVVGAGMAGGGEDGMFTERQLMGLARAVGSGKPLGRTHAKMMGDIKGAGFFDDFQKGFLGMGMGGGSDSEDEVAVVGGRKTRAKAGPSDARRRRGAMVSKLMKEKGMSLGEASKYIKEHGMA